MDFGQEAAGFGVNTGLSRLAAAAGNKLPLPNFYNPNSPNHFGDSEAGRMAHGDRKAWGHFATRQGGRVLGATLGNVILPGLGGLLGGMFGGWLGGKIGQNDTPDPQGHVTVGNINDTSGFDGVQQIDPWTGAPLPQFSDTGPYASGYQGLPQSDGAVFPDFSNYGGGGDGSGGDFNAAEAGTGAGGYYGGYDGWNGASGGMMTDFAATTNGDYQQRIGYNPKNYSGAHGAKAR